MGNKVQQTIKSTSSYEHLVDEIGGLLSDARRQIAATANDLLLKTYWQIGQYIVEYEQHGNSKATYGTELINRLSTDLRLRYGKGFSRSNLFTIRQFYIRFPKVQTLSGLLSWSHYIELLKNYFKSENTEGDNEPIGIVLGSSKNKLLMEYALQGITNKLFAARTNSTYPKGKSWSKNYTNCLNKTTPTNKLTHKYEQNATH